MENMRLCDLMNYQLQTSPQEKAFGTFNADSWYYYSTQQMVDMINKVSDGLLKLGLTYGDKVATVVYKTTPEWVILDAAMLQVGIINVPLYPTISPREYEYILNEAEVQYCFAGEGDLYDKLQTAKPHTPQLKEIYCFYSREGAHNWKELLSEQPDLQKIEQIKKTIRPHDLATIIYTSGTTGNPKGVMLSHANIIYQIVSLQPLLAIQAGDRVLSFLPVSHIFERAVVYAYTYYGASVSFTVADRLGGDTGDLKTIKPHYFTTVPRLLEKVYDKIYAKGLAAGGLKKNIFFWALKMSDTWEFDKQFSGWDGFKRGLADKLVFSKWREALGGEVKGIITGASACPTAIVRNFNAAGIKVREGYGLTETSPAISISAMQAGGSHLGTVGQGLKGTTVIIDNDQNVYAPGEGEILVQGPGVMMGYFKHQDKTDEVTKEINGQKWFCTGDIGTIVKTSHGDFLKITDRKKELLKTSLGKYVAPAPIESRLKENFLIEQAMVVGDNKKFVSALLTPSIDNLQSWCKSHAITWTNLNEMVKHPKVEEKMQEVIDKLNPEFAHHEQIKKFILLPSNWEAVKTDGTESELTPTMKLKRRVITQKFDHFIESMYV